MTNTMNVLIDDERGTPRPIQDGDLIDALAFSNDWERDWDGSEYPDCIDRYDGLTIVDHPSLSVRGSLFQTTT